MRAANLQHDLKCFKPCYGCLEKYLNEKASAVKLIETTDVPSVHKHFVEVLVEGLWFELVRKGA